MSTIVLNVSRCLLTILTLSVSRTDFLTSLSHELRSPIAVILSICELLLEDQKLAPDNRFLVTKAARAGDALLELIGTILVSSLRMPARSSIPDAVLMNSRPTGRAQD